MDDKKQTKSQTISRKRGTKSFEALSERLKKAGAQGIKMTMDGNDFWTLSKGKREEKCGCGLFQRPKLYPHKPT